MSDMSFLRHCRLPRARRTREFEHATHETVDEGVKCDTVFWGYHPSQLFEKLLTFQGPSLFPSSGSDVISSDSVAGVRDGPWIVGNFKPAQLIAREDWIKIFVVIDSTTNAALSRIRICMSTVIV